MTQRLIDLLLRARRRRVQALSFLLMNSYFLQGLKSLPCPGMNCYACPAANLACPIGTLQHFVIIREIPAYTLGVLSLIGLAVGRLACGWACPFGWLQELLYGLRHRFAVPGWRVSERWRWLPYAFLVLLVVIVPLLTYEPWFSKLCPVGTLEAGIPWLLLDAELRAQAGWLFLLKLGILVAFLVWMVATPRPFCRFVCPLGAIWSPFNRISQLRLAVDQQRCTSCGACQRVCPVDIAIHENPESMRCVRCLECVRACPEQAISVAGRS
ncbi:MAG: putative electron transport protein YccM [Chloroflexi bacterium ADurb.Bin180]|nr:MAG: putative electron transport protein YccM [Chloroflexi bacterium ADurb.Bin180]